MRTISHGFEVSTTVRMGAVTKKIWMSSGSVISSFFMSTRSYLDGAASLSLQMGSLNWVWRLEMMLL